VYEQHDFCWWRSDHLQIIEITLYISIESDRKWWDEQIKALNLDAYYTKVVFKDGFFCEIQEVKVSLIGGTWFCKSGIPWRQVVTMRWLTVPRVDKPMPGPDERGRWTDLNRSVIETMKLCHHLMSLFLYSINGSFCFSKLILCFISWLF